MSAAKRIGFLFLAIGCTGTGGCFTDGVNRTARGESLVSDLADATPINVARMQLPDTPAPLPVTPIPAPLGPPTQFPALPTAQTSRADIIPAPLASAPPSGPIQASMNVSRNAKVTVRAWVNGHPIFDDDVMQMLSPAVYQRVQRLSEPQRSEAMAEEFNHKLDDIIDQEILYQDAVKKLEKANPRALEQIRQEADKEFDKHIERIRSSGKVPEEEIKEVMPTMKKQSERDFIAMEYIRSRVMSQVQSAIHNSDVKDYYDTHLNEFQKVDTVEWQDIFIACNESRPTPAHAKRFAEDLIAKCRTNDDFLKLLSYDEGDSKFRNGMGLGTRKGEIRPAEVEEYLFRMREGEIGPVVEMSTGVHLFRVIKREYAGQMPLDEKTQAAIKRKLQNQVVEREMKRVVRELRSRSVIEIERN